MPETPPDTSNQDGNTTSGSTSTAGDEFKPITSQEELNKVVGERVKREAAKYSDYKDLKAKASLLDDLEQASKSEIERAMDRVTAAEAEVAKVPNLVADALRTHLVALHKINEDDAELFLTATDPELLLKQVQRLTGREAERSEERKKNGNTNPREGTNPKPEDDEMRAFARSVFQRT